MTQSANTRFSGENFEYNVITGEVFYIDQYKVKKNITLNAVVVRDYNEIKQIAHPKFDAIYFSMETRNVYAFTPTGWIQLLTHDQVQRVIFHLDDLLPSILTDEDGNYIAPATSIGNLYSEHGYSAADIVGKENFLRKYRVSSAYVEVEKDGQRIVHIPFPIDNFDFRQNYMGIIIENKIIDPSKYIVQDDQVILANKYFDLKAGQLILFIFYYTITLDLNDNVILNTHNYADRSITTNKLDPNIVIKAANIAESTSRLFFTPEEKSKLRGLNAENYKHPESHPASMITETDDRKWVSPKNIFYWDSKANSEDVYTKDEVVAKMYDILETEDLSAFREIAAALADDPNFATTILNKLSTKVEVDQHNELVKEVDKKVFLNDYIRSTIYDLANKYTSDDVDYYNIRVADDDFREYIDGMSVTIKIGETNMNKSKLRINELDFKPIITAEGYDMIQGELKKNSIYQLRYNGTTGNFILQGKGGVKITDASLQKYRVGKDGSVGRGNPVDINSIDTTINKSKFRADALVKVSTQFKHVDPENLYVDMPDSKTIFVSWYAENKVYATTIPYTNGYIELNANTTYTILNDKCSGYAINRIGDAVYGAVFKYKDELVRKIVPIIDGKIDLTNVEGVIEKATGIVDKLHFIKSETDRFILVYSHSNVTETVMFRYDPEKKNLVEISNRNNIDYPVDVYQRINSNQILFIGNYLNTIIGWVLTSDVTDFYNSTTTRVAMVKDPETIFENITLFQLVDNRAVMKYEISGAKCTKIVQIEANGLIKVTDETVATENDLEKKHNNIIHRQYVSFIDSYISASNYDMDVDNMTGDGMTIKVMIEREGNNGIFYTLDKDNQFLLEDEMTIHDIRSYGDKAILAYFSKDTRLKIAMFDLVRKPSGIAVDNAEIGEMCRFYKF